MAESQSSPEENSVFKLLERLRDEVPDVVEAHIFPKLNTASKRMLTCTDREWRTRTVSFYERLLIHDPKVDLRLRVYMFCGSVQLIAWAKQKGCPWTAKTCATIAASGNLEVLKWARDNDCPWDYTTCSEAAAGGHLEVLQWARHHGCEILTMFAIEEAATNGHLNVLRWMMSLRASLTAYDTVGACAAKNGDLLMLQWALEHNCLWDSKTCAGAARAGRLETLQWVREHDCPWDEDTCAAAAKGGHLETLRWAREHGCPWNEQTFADAAAGGSIEVMKYMRDEGCPWDEKTCASAAMNGRLNVLKWVRGQYPPCPWDQQTCDKAALSGLLEMGEWGEDYGPPWSKDLIADAIAVFPLNMDSQDMLNSQDRFDYLWDMETPADGVRAKHKEIIKWALDHGCPWNRRAVNADRTCYRAMFTIILRTSDATQTIRPRHYYRFE